jgi:hypothetical protein
MASRYPQRFLDETVMTEEDEDLIKLGITGFPTTIGPDYKCKLPITH